MSYKVQHRKNDFHKNFINWDTESQELRIVLVVTLAEKTSTIYNCFVIYTNKFGIKEKSTQLLGMVCTYSLGYVLSKGPLAWIKRATLL